MPAPVRHALLLHGAGGGGWEWNLWRDTWQALERSGWNQTRAATLLGLNRDQIRYRIEKFKLERPAVP